MYEIEAILKLSKDNMVISQNEEKLNAAYGPVARRFLHTKLTSGSLDMIQTNWSSTQTRVPRRSVKTNTFSAEGQNCLKRATLEVEQRFFDNETEELFADNDATLPELALTEREKVCLVLDLRKFMYKSIMSDEDWMDAINSFCKADAKFYVTQKAYEREEQFVVQQK